jgi:hypothetical protein
VRRALAVLTILILSALVAATAALAGRDPSAGVRAAQEVCPSDGSSPKPDGAGGNGNGGDGHGGQSSNGDGNADGNSGHGNSGNNGNNGNGNSDSDGDNGHGNANGNANGHGNANGNANGHGNSDGNSGNANANGNTGSDNGNANGNGNNGQGNGNGNSDTAADPNDTSIAACTSPPADPATAAVAGDGALPPAAAGETVNVEPTSGTVRIKTPGTDGFEPLAGSAQLPAGTVVDTRDGAIELTSAGGGNGEQQTAAFTGAKFEVRQDRAKGAVTEIVLRGGDFEECPRLDHGRRVQQIRNGFIAARARSTRRGLWGSGHGRFRTRGRWGSATVRGTVWHVADRCDGTLTTVRRGVVQVADFGLDRTVSVHAGESYFARVRASR